MLLVAKNLSCAILSQLFFHERRKSLKTRLYFSVPKDLDVKMKGVLMGATFLIVSIRFVFFQTSCFCQFNVK